MEKLSEEERERIRKEAYENALELYHFESEAVRGQYAEILIKGMESECLKKNEEIEKLQAFKSYVHKRLDDAGVDKDPESPHKEVGCRIGGRLDIIISKIQIAEKELIEMASTTRYTEMILRDEIKDLKEFIENNKFNNAELTIRLSEKKEQLRKELEINQQEFQARNSELSNDLYRKLQASEQRVKELEIFLKRISSGWNANLLPNDLVTEIEELFEK